MRFAYIDSQGNEVVIPTEDALRLRIELGAIVETTSFYDGPSDSWAPAGEHDVFRRLKREIEQRDQVAPLEVADLHPEPGRVEVPMPPISPSTVFERGVGSAPQGASAPPMAETSTGDEEDFDFGDFGELDLEQEGLVPARSTSPAPESPTLSYDLAASDEPADVDPWTVPGRDAWPPDPADDYAVADAAPASASPDPVDPRGTRGGRDEGGVVQARNAPDDTPEWLKNDPEFADGAPEAEPSRPFPTREQVRERYGPAAVATPKARPAPPRRRAGVSGAFKGIAAAVVLVLSIGAWWFWASGGVEAANATRVVEIPDLAPSLAPVYRAAATEAEAQLVDSLIVLPAREALPVEPDSAWLSGRYMASAGAFDSVRLYWEALGRYEQTMRAEEEAIFTLGLTEALDSIALSPGDRGSVEAHAVARFRAEAMEREAVYGQLRRVIDAALSLHEFLERNEDNIVHEPAAGGLSRDPVLEAVPISDALGEEMWTRVADITSALDALGFLERVTTDGLLDVFFGKLEGVVDPVEATLQASK